MEKRDWQCNRERESKRETHTQREIKNETRNRKHRMKIQRSTLMPSASLYAEYVAISLPSRETIQTLYVRGESHIHSDDPSGAQLKSMASEVSIWKFCNTKEEGQEVR